MGDGILQGPVDLAVSDGPFLGDLEGGVHQLADRRGVFRGTDGIVAHHAFEALHGPRTMEGEDFVEKGFAVGKGACFKILSRDTYDKEWRREA